MDAQFTFAGGECSVCCSCAGEYRCSDCGVMLFCSTYNTFWHTNNPQRITRHISSIFSVLSRSISLSVNELSITSLDSKLQSGLEFNSSEYEMFSLWLGLSTLSTLCLGTLAERFSFKPFQREVIAHCLNGNDTIVIQSTGSGKSLCYQFPAIYTGKLAIVISPTISLMMDQVKKLTEKGLPCTFVGSAQHNK